jgi:ferrous iron transport protein A
MTLDGVAPGTGAVVTAVTLPVVRERRLAELGLRRGQPVRVLHRTTGGGRLLAVGDARIAVDSRTLRAIEVRGDAA